LLLPLLLAASFDVLHYDVRLTPDFQSKSIQGRAVVEAVTTEASIDSVELDIGALTIDRVALNGAPLEFSQADRKLRARLRTPSRRGARIRLDLEYHGAPRFGLEFVPEKSQIYTIFSTSQWMPCVDAPDDKATLRLTVALPKDLTAVASGREVATRVEGGLVAHEWRLDQEASTYTFGFVAGRFQEASETRGSTRLRYLSSDTSPQGLRRIFADTKDMLAFFEDRSGIRYSAPFYSQALVAKTIGQEIENLSLMSEEYGQSVLGDPSAVGLIAHEFAHQWWGNNVTCRDWMNFWLNEGFATFMAAAYREKRFGREAYLNDVEGWRARYLKVKSAGKDRSLVFPDWSHPTSDDRALVYQKGALVLHELREQLGDRAFWKGIRAYTREHRRGSVVTADFQRAMEQATGRSLAGFFGLWVYLDPARP
jgi:aminopeptidase N